MITLEDSSPHMHLEKKKRKKKHDPISKRPQHRFCLELGF